MRVLVFQHIDVEHPGILRDLMRARGWSYDALELDVGEAIPADIANRYDLLLVMGGPMDTWQEDIHPWLVAEKAAIRHWVVEADKPYLGICLGHQLLAASLGGDVGLMAKPEVGVTHVSLTKEGRRDPLFANLPDDLLCLQWHGAEVKTLPDNAVVLASNPACATQAIRVGKHAYGLQCHIEITRDTATEWGAVPAYEAALDRVLGQGALPVLTREITESLPQFEQMAATLFGNLASLV